MPILQQHFTNGQFIWTYAWGRRSRILSSLREYLLVLLGASFVSNRVFNCVGSTFFLKRKMVGEKG